MSDAVLVETKGQAWTTIGVFDTDVLIGTIDGVQ